MWTRQTPLILNTLRSLRIETAGDLTNPVRRVAGHAGNGFGGETARQEPEEVPATALHWIVGPAEPSSEFICAQVGCEMDGS